MKGSGSLRRRLILIASVWVGLALLGTGLALGALFRSYVHDEIDREILAHLDQLTAALVIAPDGSPTLRAELSDPRFQRPYGGLYWQIETTPGRSLRSRSLWDQALAVPIDDPLPGELHRHDVDDASLGRLRLLERAVRVAAAGDQTVRLVAAMAESDAFVIVRRFERMLAISLGLIALGLVGAVAIQVSLGLQPLVRLRLAIAALRAGQATRLDGEFPTELHPVTEEIDALLTENAAMLARAQRQADDLAHGLKTPLTVLTQQADSLRQDGAAPLADLIQDQVERMRGHVDRQLARARAEGARRLGVETPVADVVDGLFRVLSPVAEARGMQLENAAPAAWRFRGARADLEEMIGNLLENALKWGRARVRVSGERRADRLTLWVDDDGPGLADAACTKAFERGRRFDEAMMGTGLGLAIVRELAEIYGGTAALGGGPLGGLRATLDLPAI